MKCSSIKTKKSKSFKNDIKFIVSYFKTDIETIFADPTFYKNKLKKNTFNDENGIVDSITTCINHFKSPKYRKILNDLINPYFLKDDIESLTRVFHSILIRLENPTI